MFLQVVVVLGSIIYLGLQSLCNTRRVTFPYLGIPDTMDQRKLEQLNFSHENKCRAIFELLFNKSFRKQRPLWLKNPETDRCLELDGYNDSIITSIGRGLAFEYDGEQHHHFVPKWHTTQEGFEKQLRRDAHKDRICREQGVMLIRIPYHVKNKEEFIYNELQKKGLYHYILK